MAGALLHRFQRSWSPKKKFACGGRGALREHAAADTASYTGCFFKLGTRLQPLNPTVHGNILAGAWSELDILLQISFLCPCLSLAAGWRWQRGFALSLCPPIDMVASLHDVPFMLGEASPVCNLLPPNSHMAMSLRPWVNCLGARRPWAVERKIAV